MRWQGLLAIVLLAGAAAAVAPFDRTIDDLFVNHQVELHPLIETTRPFAHAQPVVLIALLAGAVGWRKTGLEIIGGLLWMFALVWILKLSVGRVRPNGGPYSFPSGDAATAAVMVIPLAFRNWRSLAVTMWIAIGVATYRISHEYHWPSDVLAGLAIGLLSGWIACATYPPRWVFLSRKWWVPLALLGATMTALGWLGHGKAFVTFLTIYGIPLGLFLILSWAALFGRLFRRRRRSATNSSSARA